MDDGEPVRFHWVPRPIMKITHIWAVEIRYFLRHSDAYSFPGYVQTSTVIKRQQNENKRKQCLKINILKFLLSSSVEILSNSRVTARLSAKLYSFINSVSVVNRLVFFNTHCTQQLLLFFFFVFLSRRNRVCVLMWSRCCGGCDNYENLSKIMETRMNELIYSSS